MEGYYVEGEQEFAWAVEDAWSAGVPFSLDDPYAMDDTTDGIMDDAMGGFHSQHVVEHPRDVHTPSMPLLDAPWLLHVFDTTHVVLQTCLAHDAVPPMHKHAPAKYFIATGSVEAEPLPAPKDADPNDERIQLSLLQPGPYQRYRNVLTMRETQYVGQVKRWIRDLITRSEMDESQKTYWLNNLWSLSVRTADEWEGKVKEHPEFRKHALLRLREIIYGVLQEVRFLFTQAKLTELVGDDLAVTGYPTLDMFITVQADLAGSLFPGVEPLDDPTDLLRGEVAKWKYLEDWCVLLKRDFGTDLREMWAPIMAMHYGIHAEHLLDPKFWEQYRAIRDSMKAAATPAQ